MNISPYYLTGEIDEKETCDAAQLAEFFKKCGSGKEAKKSDKPAVIKEKPAKGKPVTVKEKTVAVKAKSDKPASAPKKAKTEKAHPAKIDDESYLLLLKAVAVRAKFGGAAKETYDKIVALLLQ